jgi:hypothetical protein
MKKLYYYPVIIHLTQEDQGITDINNRITSNYPMIDSDFKVHKNSRADVQFVIRNTDRKPIPLVGKTLTVIVVNYHTGETIFEKILQVIDEYKGMVKAEFIAADTSELELGFYHYSVHLTDENGITYPLFVDHAQNCRSYFELKPQLTTVPRPILEVSPKNFTPTNYGNMAELGKGNTRVVSSAYPGDKNKNYIGNHEHHIKVYMKDFTGRVYIQVNDKANLDTYSNDEHPRFSDWNYIKLDPVSTNDGFLFYNNTGSTDFVITKSFHWWKIHIEPLPSNTGDIYSVTHEIRKV